MRVLDFEMYLPTILKSTSLAVVAWHAGLVFELYLFTVFVRYILSSLRWHASSILVYLFWCTSPGTL